MMMMDYLKRTWKNKVAALLFVLAGWLALTMEKDATVLALCVIFALPLFVCAEDMFYRFTCEDEDEDDERAARAYQPHPPRRD
jgi:hypothetical protein